MLSKLKWKQIATKTIYYKGASLVVSYSLSPSKRPVLSFYKNHWFSDKDDKRFAFEADEKTIQELIEFLLGNVKKEFEVKSGVFSVHDCEHNIKELLLRQFLYNELGESETFDLLNQYTTNEGLIVELFKRFHNFLGFDKIIKLQSKFPDAICLRNGKEVNVELEYRSVNFKYHKHNPKECDYIVCWLHDWNDVPSEIKNVFSFYEEFMRRSKINYNFNEAPEIEFEIW